MNHSITLTSIVLISAAKKRAEEATVPTYPRNMRFSISGRRKHREQAVPRKQSVMLRYCLRLLNQLARQIDR